jgi:ribokinase
MDLTPQRFDVCVVGTAAVDLIVRVPRLPGEGETVLADSAVEFPGGKGLNQAIAAAHAGGSVMLASTAGDDQRGPMLLDALVGAGVETAAFRLLPGMTGIAVVQVPPSGDSSVTLGRTETSLPRAGDIVGLHQWLAPARVTIVQLELERGSSLTSYAPRAVWWSERRSRHRHLIGAFALVLTCSL